MCFATGAHTDKVRPVVVLSSLEYQRTRPDVVVGFVTSRLPQPLTPSD
jgi:mRNA-degrading endonuclease toxin of MazEF toxin-antitoxin module